VPVVNAVSNRMPDLLNENRLFTGLGLSGHTYFNDKITTLSGIAGFITYFYLFSLRISLTFYLLKLIGLFVYCCRKLVWSVVDRLAT